MFLETKDRYKLWKDFDFEPINRFKVKFPAKTGVDFANFFNLFPASHWNHWTVSKNVKLSLNLQGKGKVSLCKSNLDNPEATSITKEIIAVADFDNTQEGSIYFEYSLEEFVDGGILWFELDCETEVILSGDWSVDGDPKKQNDIYKANLGITTFNNSDEVIIQLNRLASDAELLKYVNKIIVVDQGTDKVVDNKGYTDAAKPLGDQLQLIKQGNLGGAGGFSRSMLETLNDKNADAVLLMDDDILVETESILRSILFQSFCKDTTIVGGHMMNLHFPNRLHNFGEYMDDNLWEWKPLFPNPEVDKDIWKFYAIDFSKRNFLNEPKMHKRYDPDFNAWWMCLVPREVIEKQGLALPVFIKWDDVEYGIRAKKNGFPTCTLLGVGVWHMPWTDKPDEYLTWASYYLERNKLVTALIHQETPHSGPQIDGSRITDLRFLTCMQYSPVEIRLQALEDILAGPEHLHKTLSVRNPEVRSKMKNAADTKIYSEDELPEVILNPELSDPSKALEPKTWQKARKLEKKAIKYSENANCSIGDFKTAEVRYENFAQYEWFRFWNFNSVLVKGAALDGYFWYRRDSKKFSELYSKSVRLHKELDERWEELQRIYRNALDKVTSPEEWEKHFK
jgi:galactofuranosylgalactofuranosylrhamnosyl-N-acetylglucosaminyl-diphospho-decaprenol beta-1,5/1,6-galactofuranosyltransferase